MSIAGIILAAGRSSRMGRNKAQLSIDGEPLLSRLVRVYREAGLEPIAVVGAHAVADAIVVAGGEQMIDSLANAIAALPEDATAAVVQPVDAAFTSVEAIRALVADPSRACVLSFEGTPGHPVLVPRALFAGVMARPQGGLRTLLDDAAQIEWDRSVLADLDTPEDLAAWRIDA